MKTPVVGSSVSHAAIIGVKAGIDAVAIVAHNTDITTTQHKRLKNLITTMCTKDS